MSIANNGMTKIALNGYKEDAIKILQTQINMLSDIESEILSKEGESNTDDSKNEGILTSETCKAFQQILNGEVHKLQNFDVVLAVVGTMKAGKSTTINAIVGREILPNRNRPMTSLPTLICHNKEQEIPKLTFSSQPINNFLVDVRSVLGVCSIENPSPEIVELIDFIQDNRLFSDTYNGETDIFDFLQRLNDLVRLAATINEIAKNEVLNFPYDSYQNIDALPMIDVAFKLQDDFETNGRFMLLDTAGPNESGHKELLGLLREQLKRSSAVMLVLDYTQLNSEAEESIKNEIEAIPTIQKSRLFALVNKFDQKTANSDEAEATKKHIFNNLLKDKIDFEHIYPISAQSAYLANRMYSALSNDNIKPSYKEGSWTADFASKAYGQEADQEDYEEKSIEKLIKSAEKMSAKSGINTPLTDVILNMQKNAPFIAIQSALAGASDVFEKLHNFFNIRGHFAEKEKMTNEEIINLENIIAGIKSQIDLLKSTSNNIQNEFPKIKTASKLKMKKKEEEKGILISISQELDKMFDLETKKLQKNLDEIDSEIITTPIQWMITKESSVERKFKLAALAKAKELAKSDKYSLIFPDEKTLNEFQDLVVRNTSDLIINITDEYHDILQESIKDTQKITKGLYDSCNYLLNSLQEEFNREGIKEIKIDSIDSDINKNKENSLAGFSVEATHNRTIETRHESGITSKAKRWFGKKLNKNWGTYEVDIETYTINKRGISEKLKKTIEDKVIIPLGKEIESALSQLLENNIISINEFNSTVKSIVEEMNNAIIQEKMPDLEEMKLYKEKIVKLQESSRHTEENWEKLSKSFAVEKIDTQLKGDIAA